jgi:hypothetical protein
LFMSQPQVLLQPQPRWQWLLQHLGWQQRCLQQRLWPQPRLQPHELSQPQLGAAPQVGAAAQVGAAQVGAAQVGAAQPQPMLQPLLQQRLRWWWHFCRQQLLSQPQVFWAPQPQEFWAAQPQELSQPQPPPP